MSSDNTTDAIVIPLDVWQDPQGDVVLVYSEHECSIYFACWETSGKAADFIAHLSFEHVVGVRSFPREFVLTASHRTNIARISCG